MADRAHNFADEKLETMEKRLSAIYSRAAGEIEAKANAYLQRFEDQDNKKRALLEKGKITEEEYKRWRKNKIMYSKRFDTMKEQCAVQLLHVNETAAAYINGELPEVYAVSYNSLEEAVDGVGGYSFTMVDADTVRNLVMTDKSIIPLKEIDPEKDIPWNMKNINAEVLQGILQGESMDEIAKRVGSVQKMNETAAIRTARTAVTGAENKGRQDSYARAEADGIILQKKWISTNDRRTRHTHLQKPEGVGGEIVDQDQPFSNGLMFPGDPSGRADEVYNCRCTMAAVVKGFEKNPKKSLINDRNNDIIETETIVHSVGAKSPSYPTVNYPETDTPLDFVYGTKPIYSPDHTMAGKGCKTGRKIDDIDRLVDTYKCDADGWQKEKAVYEVYDAYGEIRKVELHWYQHKDIGKIEYKVKTKGGYVYIDEWED